MNTTPRITPSDPDADWRRSALCAQVDPDLFFPETGGVPKAAQQICARCSVTEQCRADAAGGQYGVWAGQTRGSRNAQAKANVA